MRIEAGHLPGHSDLRSSGYPFAPWYTDVLILIRERFVPLSMTALRAEILHRTLTELGATKHRITLTIRGKGEFDSKFSNASINLDFLFFIFVLEQRK